MSFVPNIVKSEPNSFKTGETDSVSCLKPYNDSVSSRLKSGTDMLQFLYTKVVNPSSCEASDGRIIVDVVGGEKPYTFHWSNGEVTENIENISGGNFDLTVTDAKNTTILVHFKTICKNLDSASIEGKVLVDGNASRNDKIILYKSNDSYFTPVSMTYSKEDGSFVFNHLSTGKYIVQSLPSDGNDQLATYFPNEPASKDAYVINLTGKAFHVTISATNSSLSTSGCSLAGEITSDDSPYSALFESDNRFYPGNVILQLKNGTGTLANAITGDDGTYRFENVPDGEYKLYVEHLGYSSDSIALSIKTSECAETRYNFTLRDRKATASFEKNGQEQPLIYPNPASNVLRVPYSQHVSIMRLDGVEVLNDTYTDRVYVGDLNSGLYVVKCTSNTSYVIYQFEKNSY